MTDELMADLKAAAPGYLIGADAAFPPSGGRFPAIAKVGAFYIGGDTPHVWTTAEINAMAAGVQYLVPVFVRSNPPGPGGAADAQAARARLDFLKAPQDCAVVLDLETATDAAYVDEFRHNMGSHPVVPYGSTGSLFGNPGIWYWSAQPGVAAPNPKTVGTQYYWGQDYDLSWWKASFAAGHFWATKSAPKPGTHGPYKQEAPGTRSINAIARDRHTTVEHLVETTLNAGTAAEKAALISYLCTGAFGDLPAGAVYYTTNP